MPHSRSDRKKARVAAGAAAFASGVNHLVDKRHGTTNEIKNECCDDMATKSKSHVDVTKTATDFTLGLGDISILNIFATINRDDLSRYKQDEHFSKRLQELKTRIENPAARTVAAYLLEEKEYHDRDSSEDRAAWEWATKMLKDAHSSSKTR